MSSPTPSTSPNLTRAQLREIKRARFKGWDDTAAALRDSAAEYNKQAAECNRQADRIEFLIRRAKKIPGTNWFPATCVQLRDSYIYLIRRVLMGQPQLAAIAKFHPTGWEMILGSLYDNQVLSGNDRVEVWA